MCVYQVLLKEGKFEAKFIGIWVFGCERYFERFLENEKKR